jgi:hypothetical protein
MQPNLISCANLSMGKLRPTLRYCNECLITARDKNSKSSSHSGTPRTFFFMAQTRKLVTVYGATGNQGRSVVKSLLRAPDSFEVRAITRNPNSVAAQELSTLGASLVQADGSQSNQMTEAFQGSWAVFLNINSDDPVSGFQQPYAPSCKAKRMVLRSFGILGVPPSLITAK